MRFKPGLKNLAYELAEEKIKKHPWLLEKIVYWDFPACLTMEYVLPNNQQLTVDEFTL